MLQIGQNGKKLSQNRLIGFDPNENMLRRIYDKTLIAKLTEIIIRTSLLNDKHQTSKVSKF